MRLARLKAPGGLENLKLMDEPYQQPQPGELLVRVRACSLNFHDDMVVTGKIPCADGRIPMTDGAGEVIAVGPDVEEFQVGDAVVSTFYPDWLDGDLTPRLRRAIPGDSIDGYAADFVCKSENAFTKAPAGYTHLEAATLPCAAVTAWRCLVVSGQVRLGDTVLVLGSGAVSLFALQFAKAAGARVIATSSSEEKLERLKHLGADDVINYKAVTDWGLEAKRLTDGRGVDHVIEVGGPATLAQSIAACCIGGHIALIGVLSGFSAEISIPAIFSNQIRVSGISIGSRSDQHDMVRAITVNNIKPVIDGIFPLGEIVDAFRAYELQRHFGKICLEM